MTQGYLYIIQDGDTIKSIGKKLALHDFEFVGYHNASCSPEEKIVKDRIPEHLEYLLLRSFPPNIQEEFRELVIERKRTLLSGTRLLLLPSKEPLYYGTNITIHNGEKQNAIKYTTKVLLIDRAQEGEYIFELSRTSKTFLNEEEVNDIAGELAIKAAKVLYPLQLIVDNTGKWIRIHNYKEIYDRWQKIKDAILKEYDGETVEQYLRLCERTLENEDVLFRSLSADLFLRAYFAGIYVDYSQAFSFTTEYGFPMLENANEVNYKTVQKLAKYLNRYDEILVQLDGGLNDARSKEDLKHGLPYPYYNSINNKSEKASGSFNAKYFLNSNSIIEYCYVCCSLELEKVKKVEVSIAQINEPSEYETVMEI